MGSQYKLSTDNPEERVSKDESTFQLSEQLSFSCRLFCSLSYTNVTLWGSVSMDGEIQGRSNNARRSVGPIRVLVVDDDSICLAVVAGMLKAYKYEVLAVKNPRDALATLRMKQGSIDLVVTDVHMPEMDGFQFQKRVYKEFNLPVIMMSSNDDEDVMVKGLEEGAAFFMVKPVSANDVKNIWQHTIKGKINKGNNVAVQKIRTSSLNISPFAPDKPSYEDVDSISTSADEQNEDGNQGRKKYKRKAMMNNDDEISDDCVRKKKGETKPKVVWSAALHDRFLLAISQIGIEKSVPKKILEFMNVPGLTRENVASHLQKYRIFIRKSSNITDEVSTNTAADRFLLNKPLFTSNSSTSLYDSYKQKYSKFIEHQQQKKRARLQGVGLGSKNNILMSQTTNSTIQLPLKPQNQIYQSDLLSSSTFGLNRLNYVPMIQDFSNGGYNSSGGLNNPILNFAKGADALSYNYQNNGLICGQKKTSSIESTGSINALPSDVNNLTRLDITANSGIENQMMLPRFGGDYFSSVVQHETDLVQQPPQSMPPLPPLSPLQGEEDKSFSDVFGFMDNSSIFDVGDMSQIDDQSLNPQENGDEVNGAQKLSHDNFTCEADDVLDWLDIPIPIS